jgi:hypothetical protein
LFPNKWLAKSSQVITIVKTSILTPIDSIMSSQELSDVEKEVPKVNYLERSATEEANDARINRFTPAEQSKIIRRIDRRLVLTLGFLYCVSLMDRINLGIAVVSGMGVDLILTGSRYSLIVLVFFITYVILQVPSSPEALGQTKR